jgi:hypothetical protein
VNVLIANLFENPKKCPGLDDAASALQPGDQLAVTSLAACPSLLGEIQG